VLPFRFAKSQLYVERGCVDEDCITGPKKEKTPTPASDVLRDAKDAPLEGLGRIHGFSPSSPLLFKRTVRRPELRKIVPLANTTIHEIEQRGRMGGGLALGHHLSRYKASFPCFGQYASLKARPGVTPLSEIGGAPEAPFVAFAVGTLISERPTHRTGRARWWTRRRTTFSSRFHLRPSVARQINWRVVQSRPAQN
jgi:hypothetical protein